MQMCMLLCIDKEIDFEACSLVRAGWDLWNLMSCQGDSRKRLIHSSIWEEVTISKVAFSFLKILL